MRIQKRHLPFNALTCILFLMFAEAAFGQATQPASTGEASANYSSNGSPQSNQASSQATEVSPTSWLAYDRRSGRWYQQRAVAVSVPVVRWQFQPQTHTVYEVQPRVTQQPTQQTVFVPQTQTVMVPRVVGGWNPFRRPTLSYQFEPVTQWVAQTQTISTSVVVPEVVAKQQTVQVPKPVQSVETHHQIVQQEVAPPKFGVPLGAVAVNPSPVFPWGARANLASSQPAPRMLGSNLIAAQPMPGLASTYWSPDRSPIATPVSKSQGTLPHQQIAASNPASTHRGLRPILPPARPLAGGFNPPYAAPLRSSSVANVAARDEFQSGMAATVLR